MPPMLYLIDGHALAYRTFFALTSGGTNRFHTHSGEPTAGVFGFVSVLLKILEEDKPDFLAVAFDTGRTFRHDLYTEYKATREKMPDDLRVQIERLRQLIDAFPFPRLEVEGYEADDVLGSVAQEAVRKGLGVKIITGDRDLLQLVTGSIIVNLAGAKLSEAKDYFPEGVQTYLGVRPDQVIDYKGLVGDASDNIPGVKGIGDKTAITLLEKYQTLAGVYEHLDDLTPKMREKLEAGKDLAFLSKDLATIKTDLPIQLDLEKARIDSINKDAVLEIFRELEFRTLSVRFLNYCQKIQPESELGQLGLFADQAVLYTPASTQLDLETVVVDTPEKLGDLVEVLKKTVIVALDTESTGVDPMAASLVGISLAVTHDSGYYIPLGHEKAHQQLPLQKVCDALVPVLNQKKIVGHNLKYDWLILDQHGFHLENLYFDTMIAQWLIDPASHNLGLKNLAEVRLHKQMTPIEELIGKGKNQITMAQVDVEKAAAYAAADAAMTLALVPDLKLDLEKHQALKLFEELEMPLIMVLGRMEQRGITLDLPLFAQMSEELSSRLAQIEKDVYSMVGYEFNLNSTQQLSKALHETLQIAPLDPRKKTASGHYSTSFDNLDPIKDQHAVIPLVLEYRELAKLKSTYVDSLPLQVNPISGRVHTSFNQTGSVTGRLASQNPNLQNIPVRTDVGRKVRDGFVAAKDMVLLSVDYSQVELRIVAHLAQDEAMLEAFRQGKDIHSATAAAVRGIALEQVTKAMRSHAKAINFGLIYGMSAFGLSQGTDLTLGEAENFVKKYFEEFPGVKQYLDSVRRHATTEGYVETLLGRRRYFPELQKQTNFNLRRQAEREAINAPVQGSAADIMKLAMIHLSQILQKSKLKARMLLQVHDELLLECPPQELGETARLVQDVMEKAYQLSIPLVTEARTGRKWGEMQVME